MNYAKHRIFTRPWHAAVFLGRHQHARTTDCRTQRQTASSYFWVYHYAEHEVHFDFHKTRAKTCLDHILIGKDGDLNRRD